jgi:acyl-coenzyme A synthetase/AMP-(fatty) acid ligase
MKKVHTESKSLRDQVAQISGRRFFYDRDDQFCYTDLGHATSLSGRLASLSGCSVLLATSRQLATALAMIELDGHARRLIILPPDIEPDHLGDLIAIGEVDAVVTDSSSPSLPISVRHVQCSLTPAPLNEVPSGHSPTEWVLLTSGTTGIPKMVVHDLGGLSATTAAASPADGADVWGTFYDIRRYGGLQIFLRALFGGASLILSNATEPVSDYLARLGARGVTHLSGTPSHWRRAMINPAIGKIAPRYVRLSGEIADQAVLDALRETFPRAAIGHAYASTEAGVAFDVNDGLAGFPAAYIGPTRNGVEMKVIDGSLRIRSARTASRYIGTEKKLVDADCFVDTGDMVEQRNDRYHFIGRKDGIINVGGLKVHPEEIEAVINQHPQVRMSLVHSRPSPFTGAIVVADVVLKSECATEGSRLGQMKDDILKLCRDALPRHKVPAMISIVPSVEMAGTGKMARRYS